MLGIVLPGIFDDAINRSIKPLPRYLVDVAALRGWRLIQIQALCKGLLKILRSAYGNTRSSELNSYRLTTEDALKKSFDLTLGDHWKCGEF